MALWLWWECPSGKRTAYSVWWLPVRIISTTLCGHIGLGGHCTYWQQLRLSTALPRLESCSEYPPWDGTSSVSRDLYVIADARQLLVVFIVLIKLISTGWINYIVTRLLNRLHKVSRLHKQLILLDLPNAEKWRTRCRFRIRQLKSVWLDRKFVWLYH